MTDKHMLDGLAQECEGSAEQTGCWGSNEILLEDGVNAEQVSLEDNFIIEISNQMKSVGLSVRDLGYGTESNKQVKMVCKVVLVSG